MKFPVNNIHQKLFLRDYVTQVIYDVGEEKTKKRGRTPSARPRLSADLAVRAPRPLCLATLRGSRSSQSHPLPAPYSYSPSGVARNLGAAFTNCSISTTTSHCRVLQGVPLFFFEGVAAAPSLGKLAD